MEIVGRMAWRCDALGFQIFVCSYYVETITTFLSLTESVNWTVASWD